MAIVNPYYQILSWDSELFGYLVARISDSIPLKNIKRVVQELQEKKVNLVYWFIKPISKGNQVAVAHNGVLVDVKMTFIKKLSLRDIVKRNKHITSYKKKWTAEKLFPLVLESGKYSRFHVDNHFRHNEFEKLYKEWITTSVLRKKAFDVLIYSDSEELIKGFITLEKNNSTGIIGLTAVDKKYQGKGIGKALVREALSRFQKKGLKKVEVGTQKSNDAAVAFYQKLGFAILREVNVYHFWL